MRSEGVEVVKGESDAASIERLLKAIFPKMTLASIDEILKQRGVGVSDDITEIPDDVVEDVFGRDDQATAQDRGKHQIHVWCCVLYYTLDFYMPFGSKRIALWCEQFHGPYATMLLIVASGRAGRIRVAFLFLLGSMVAAAIMHFGSIIKLQCFSAVTRRSRRIALHFGSMLIRVCKCVSLFYLDGRLSKCR